MTLCHPDDGSRISGPIPANVGQRTLTLIPRKRPNTDSNQGVDQRERRLVPIHKGALYAGVHDDTIRRKIAAGQLTGYRFGTRVIRVDLNEIDSLLKPVPTVRRGQSNDAA